MPVVLWALRDERVARVEVDRDVELGDRRPEVPVARIVEVDDRVLVVDLGEAVDEGTDEAEVADRAGELLRRGVRILHGKSGERGEALGVDRDLVGRVVIEPVRPVDSLGAFVERLDARGEEGEDDLLDAEFVHLLQARLMDVEQRGSPLRPGLGGEVLGGLFDDVGVGGAEVLFEGDLLHGGLSAPLQ